MSTDFDMENQSIQPAKHQFVTSRTLATQLQEITTLSDEEAYSIVINLCKMIRNAVVEGKIVNMKHLGVFKQRTRKEHPGYNFKTGERTVIASCTQCKFVASKEFTEQLAAKTQETITKVSMNLIEGDALENL